MTEEFPLDVGEYSRSVTVRSSMDRCVKSSSATGSSKCSDDSSNRDRALPSSLEIPFVVHKSTESGDFVSVSWAVGTFVDGQMFKFILLHSRI